MFKFYKKYKFTPNDLKYAPRDYIFFEPPKGRALLYQSILSSVDEKDDWGIVMDSFMLKKAFERDGLENAFIFELSSLLKKAKNPPSNYTVFYKNNIEPKITQIAKAEPSQTQREELIDPITTIVFYTKNNNSILFSFKVNCLKLSMWCV